MESKPEEVSSVGVAVRVRPLNNSEKAENSQGCITIDPKERVLVIGKDRSFTFDQVFGVESKQFEIFENCTKDLVTAVFSGYNATVLAYGQTGSGKTFTMGSGQVSDIQEEEIGIIPRVIQMIFNEVEKRKQLAEFIIKVSFLEIYNEEIHDLLEANSMVPEKSISIREDKGSIFLMGLHEEKVANCEEMLTCLERGTMQRIVASTLMNAVSSRSHAIFTINIEQQVIEVQPEVTEGQEYMMAKFHFVDLAGSERAKRTGASGATLREGISINKGLLCLGNVISALTEESQKKHHIPYRDSKLTRILQDSLGGNAKTYMIACISPAEINYEETLNTLKYASRARNIKNKPVVNRDPQSAIISQLRQDVTQLKQEIKNYRDLLLSTGNEEIKANLEMMKKDYAEPHDEEKIIKAKLQQAEKKIAQITGEMESSKYMLGDYRIEMLQLKKERDISKSRLERYIEIVRKCGVSTDEDEENSVKLIDEYNDIIEKLKRTHESKDLLINELQMANAGLEKELDREKKLLQKKTEELENLKRKSKSGQGTNEVIMKNVDDYGRIFAETIMATIQKQETCELEEDLSEDLMNSLDTKSESEELLNVDCKIKEKEEILKNIEEAFKDLQSQLVDEMSKQYYKKIEDLELEKKATEKDRDLALEKIKEGSSLDKQIVADKFKSKISALEEKLKENKRKDKELNNLQKLVETQKFQLGKLDEEIRKAKTERIRLQKKWKEEAEEIAKWKSQKQKELLSMKRTGLKKDQEIKVLKSENRKKEILARKKTDEVAAIQRRQRDAAVRKKNPKAVVNIDTLRQWVVEYTVACVEEKEINLIIGQEMQEKDECEKEIFELNSTCSQKILKLERLELILSDNEPEVDQDELYTNIRSLNMEIEEISDRIDDLENNIKRKTELIISYSRTLANSKIEEVKSRALTVSSMEDSQNLVLVLFEELLEKALELKKFERKLLQKDAEVSNQQSMIAQAEHEKEILIKSYNLEILKLKNEVKLKEIALIEELEDFKEEGATDASVASETGKEKVKLDEEKPKNKIHFISLNKARELNKKKKTTIEEEVKIRKSPITSRLTKVQDDETTPKTPMKTRIFSDLDQKTMQKWKLISTTDTQKGPIYSMIAQENILYTSSSQTIKVWSLDTLSFISEINAHTSLIKSMAISPENSMIFNSCSNLVKIWDTINLQTIGTLQVPVEEVRALKIRGCFLYTVGKSTENSNSIYIWDLRKSQSPVVEIEKNQDVFCLEVSDDFLYYSRKSNNVCRCTINTNEVEVFAPAHSNIVTCMKIYKETLISGSRDRAIKQWDIENKTCKKTISNSHTDLVNCLEVDHLERQFYSAGKEGKIKVWRGTDNLKLVGESLGMNTNILSLSSIVANEPTVVSGGTDKSFKIWKLIEDI